MLAGPTVVTLESSSVLIWMEITFAFFCARGIEEASGVGFEAGGMAQVAGYSWAFSARLQCPQG